MPLLRPVLGVKEGLSLASRGSERRLPKTNVLCFLTRPLQEVGTPCPPPPPSSSLFCSFACPCQRTVLGGSALTLPFPGKCTAALGVRAAAAWGADRRVGQGRAGHWVPATAALGLHGDTSPSFSSSLPAPLQWSLPFLSP